MLCFKDDKLADRLGHRFKAGITAIPKFIDGNMQLHFPEGARPPVKYKHKSIGYVAFIGEDGKTVGIEMTDNKGMNYIFNAKHKKHIRI